ncbi:uncharacterized protein AC631_02754 [Debaryomyces fabryi]|uniref:Uncharacterized protein n=1 Tax=Debaryomyces fabryi TaxID=58627 RepID=A0A0V1PYX0_9ASCO|nr:uncharacterized protein AC631_02754 [Debaryomyces fabryi]KSA01460.1 hypothetical protein AC631_02754 [Debaryomyces fabryi]CUM57401.1 unnamed protein product [Debaryomyces fabryi]
MSQEEKHGLLNKLKKPFRSHSRSSSINSEKAPGSAGTAGTTGTKTSSGSKRGTSGAAGTTSGGSGASGVAGATGRSSIEELAYQEGRKRAELDRKGGVSSGTGSGAGSGATLGAGTGAGVGAGAGAAVSSPSSKSYRSGHSFDDGDTVLSSPKGRVVRHPPKIHRVPVDKDVGGDFANQKLPIDESLVNKDHFGNGSGAGTGAGATGAYGSNTAGQSTGTGTGAGSRETTGAGAGTGAKPATAATVGAAAAAGAVAGAAGTAAYAGSKGKNNSGNHGVIENDRPSYSDDASKKEGTGVFFDPRDTQGGVYGHNNGSEMSEATKAELNRQRNLKTHPSAYYEEQRQKEQQNSVIDDIKNSAYNEGQAQGSRDAKTEQHQKDQAAQESGQESSSKYNDPEKEHAKNKSAWNRDGVTTAAAEARGQSGTNTSNSLYSERGLGAAAAGAAAGGAGAAGLAAHSNKKSAADNAYGSGTAAGTNKTYSTDTTAVGAANASADLSDSDYDYDRQIKELDRRIASTQKEIDQVNASGSGVYGASASTPSTSAGTSSVSKQASGTAGSGQIDPRTTATSAEQENSSNKGLLAGTGIAAAIAGAAGYVGLGGKSHEKETVDDAYGQGVKNASANTGASKSILDEAYKQGVISGSYDAGKEYFRQESSKKKSAAGAAGSSSTAPGTGTYKDKDVATTDIYLKEDSSTVVSSQTNASNDDSSNKTGILAGSGIAAAIAGAAGYVGLGGKSHDKETVDEAYEEGIKAASGSSNVDKVHETKAEAFVKDPNAVSNTDRTVSQTDPSFSSKGSNAAAGAAGGGVLGAVAAMASNTLGFDSDDNVDDSKDRALVKDSAYDTKKDTLANDPTISSRDAEINDDGTLKPGVLGGVTGAISAAGAVAAAKVGLGGSSPSDIINEAYEAGREQGNIINEAYEAGRKQGSIGSSSSKGGAYGSSASSKTSRSIDTPQLQDVDDDDDEEDEDEDEDAAEANTTTNSTRSGLFAGVFGGAAAAMGLSSLDRSDSNKSGIDPSKVDSQKDTVPREDLAKANLDNSSGSGILGALGFNKSGEPSSSQGNLIDAAEDGSGDVKSQPKHSTGARALENDGQNTSGDGDGVQKVPNLPSTSTGGIDRSESNKPTESSRKDTVPDKDLAKEGTTGSRDNDKSSLGIGAAVGAAAGAAAGALGYAGSKSSSAHNDGSLIDPAARNFEDVAKAPAHGGDAESEGIKKSHDDVEKSKAEDEPKTSHNFKQTEAEVAAYNKKHGVTDDKRSLIEIAEGASPEIKKMEAHHGASSVSESNEDGIAASGDGVQPIPKSVLQHQNRFIATGGREGELSDAVGSESYSNTSELDAKKKSLTNENVSLESSSDKSSNRGLKGAAAGAAAGVAGAVGLSSASDKHNANSKDTESSTLAGANKPHGSNRDADYSQDREVDRRVQEPSTSTKDPTGVATGAGVGTGAGAAYGASQGSNTGKKSTTTLSEKELYEYYEAGIIRGSYEAGQILGAEEASLATSKADNAQQDVSDSKSSGYGKAAAGAAGAGALGGAAGYGLASSGRDVNAEPSANAYDSQPKASEYDTYGQTTKESSHAKGVEEGAYSKGVEQGAYTKGVEESAYSKGVEQGAYESGKIEGKHSSASKNAAIGAGVGAGAGLAAGTAYGTTHDKSSKQTGSTLNDNELYAFYVAGIIQGSYEAGQIAGAEDASLSSSQAEKSQSEASHGHGLGTAAAAGVVGAGAAGAGAAGLAASSKNKGAEESNLLVEVIGVKDEQAASKIAHQASKELSAQGVDLTHGKLVINTQTKEVYKTDDVNEKVGANTGSHSGRNALAGGAAGGAAGAGLGHSVSDRQGGLSPRGSQKNFESTNPNDHHDEHQKAKERLSAAANAGVLGNVQPSGTQAHHEREYDPSAGQSQSHHESHQGLKAGAAGAGLGAAGAAAAAAAYGSHSRDTGAKGYEGGVSSSNRTTGNYSANDHHSSTGHSGQGISSREATGPGVSSQGAAGHSDRDTAGSKPSDGSDIVVTVQGTKDNAEATRIATQTVEALKKQPSVLASVKELRIDANTGIVTNEHGKRIDLNPSSGRSHHETQDASAHQGSGAGSAIGLGAGAAGLGAAGAYGAHKHSEKTGTNQQQSYQDTQSSRSGAYGAHQAETQQGYQDSQNSRLGGSGTNKGYEDAYQNRSRGTESSTSTGLGAAGAAGAAGAVGAVGAHKYSHQDTQNSRLGGNGDIYQDAYDEGYKQGSYRKTGTSSYDSANVAGSNYKSTRDNAPDQVAPTTATQTSTQPESTGLRMPGSFF